jgi:LDH2 family malate/lactate/ureidoglycolate dehydrogenase
MAENYFVVPEEIHNELIKAALEDRAFAADEALDTARSCASAAKHGIRIYNAIETLRIDRLSGSAVGGCIPRATIQEIHCRYKASRVWNAGRKIGPPVANRALNTCMKIAGEYGIATVSVDNCFHYFWGGGYVMEAAKKGFIAFATSTSLSSDIVPQGGAFPTLGKNSHSWAFPTVESLGFPLLFDSTSATQVIDRIQLIDEVLSAFIGGSLPTLRGKYQNDGEKHTSCFFFQVIHPEAISSGAFAKGRLQRDNVKAVLQDILGHGNEHCYLPGQNEAHAANASAMHGGLLFTKSEIDSLNEIATTCSQAPLKIESFKTLTL